MGNTQQSSIIMSSSGSPADETTSLLSNSKKTDSNNMCKKCSLPSISGGTCSSTTNGDSSNDEESQRSEEDMEHSHDWLIPFFVNIFLACASFSIVMPSLSPYLLEVGASMSCLPWAVASYSVGEMIGSVAIGTFYEYATQRFAVGRGPRWSLIMCTLFGIVGSALYAAAGWVGSENLAENFIVAGRFFQGVWTGGQQAVEQGESFYYASSISSCLLY